MWVPCLCTQRSHFTCLIDPVIPSRLIAIECLLFWIAFAIETVGCCIRWYAILLAEIVRALVESNVSLGDHGLANISLSVGSRTKGGQVSSMISFQAKAHRPAIRSLDETAQIYFTYQSLLISTDRLCGFIPRNEEFERLTWWQKDSNDTDRARAPSQ